MYGSCQTTKWHYLVQQYYMKEYLPEEMQRNNLSDFDNRIEVYEDYSGSWKTWFENGDIESTLNFSNGKYHGRIEKWHYDGPKAFKGFHVNGTPIGLFETWYFTGKKKSESVWENGIKISSKEWGKTGKLK